MSHLNQVLEDYINVVQVLCKKAELVIERLANLIASPIVRVPHLLHENEKVDLIPLLPENLLQLLQECGLDTLELSVRLEQRQKELYLYISLRTDRVNILDNISWVCLLQSDKSDFVPTLKRSPTPEDILVKKEYVAALAAFTHIADKFLEHFIETITNALHKQIENIKKILGNDLQDAYILFL